MQLRDTIGNTALLDLTWLIAAFSRNTDSSSTGTALHPRAQPPQQGVSLFAKCEYLNPTGSIKDRIAAYMVHQAEKEGLLKRGYTLIESTSGNTGAAVALIGAIKGYRPLLVIPERVSQEKQSVLRALGAAVEVVPGDVAVASEAHYVRRAAQLAQSLPNSFYLNQYNNPNNAAAHYHTTGPEIWSQTKGAVDVFVTVAGSGGTISGVGRYLKSKKPAVRIIAVDPIGSVYSNYLKKGLLLEKTMQSTSLVEGAGSDQLNAAMDFSVVDEVITFADRDAFSTARWLAKKTGILAGGSSGANIWAAMQLAQAATQPLCIVTLLPDSGLKYLSKFYNDAWMQERIFIPK